MGFVIKNLLVASVIGLASMSTAWAQVVSYYDFSYSSSNETITGTFGVDSSNIITAITGNMSGAYNSSISSIVSPGGPYSNDNLLIYPASPTYLNDSGVSFLAGSNQFNISTSGGSPYALVGTTGISSFGSMNVTPSGGAPEIDGALAPKVGFLLGCLYLLFGRKKQQGALLKTI